MNHRTTGPREYTVPEGDDRQRLQCPDCGFIAYENPRIVVGSVPRHEGRFLLCRRSIAPREGYWTLPAGFLELNETTETGARREAWEEARARLELGPILAVYSVTHINQVQIFYRARLLTPEVAAGPESLEVALFEWEAIPWDQLAFPTVRWALEQEHRTLAGGPVEAAANPEPESELP